jgi:enoyl-CoA hydratase
MSAYEQFGMGINEAMANEFEWGLRTLAKGEYLKGSGDFIEGKGKHGDFND